MKTLLLVLAFALLLLQSFAVPSVAGDAPTTEAWLLDATKLSDSDEPHDENVDAKHAISEAGSIPLIAGRKETADADTTLAARSRCLPPSARRVARKTSAVDQREDGRFRSSLERSEPQRHVSFHVTAATAESADSGASHIGAAREGRAENNSPVDLLTLRADYAPGDLIDPKTADWSVYSFLVGAAQRFEDPSRIDRIGLGGHRRFGRWGRISGEVSSDNSNLRTQAAGSCHVNDWIQLYSRSGFDSQGTDGTLSGLDGTFTGGAKVRASEKASFIGEERVQVRNGLNGLTHVFGLDLTPASGWTCETRLEIGDTRPPGVDRHRHRAGRITLGYARKDIRSGGHIEWHLQSDGLKDERIAWEARNDIAFQMQNGWHLRGHWNTSLAPTSGDSLPDVVGMGFQAELAHRPSDRHSFGLRIKYSSPLSDRVWPGSLEGNLFAFVNPTMRVGLGYTIHHDSIAGKAPFPDGQACFLELTGTY